MIIPPPDLREYVDKTAKFVAQNGKEFEDRIKGMGEAKFGFLQEDHPFYKYYMKQVDEFALQIHEESKNKESEPSKEPSIQVSSDAKEKDEAEEAKPQQVIEKAPTSSVIGIAARAVSRASHPGFNFCTITSDEDPILKESSQVIETMRTTARYAAVLGSSFVASVSTKEAHNPEFSFLKSSSSLFTYFESLVEQYKRVLDWEDLMGTLNSRYKNKMAVLDRTVQYSEAKRKGELEEAEKQLDTRSSTIAFYEIDWHDFVLVETITFDEPIYKTEIPAQRSNAGIEDMDVEDDRNDEKIKIRKNYKPVVDAGVLKKSVVALPDGRHINANELNEHMRVEMLDPKWQEQKNRFLEKQKVVPFVERDISKNLANMATHRPDVFGRDEIAERKLVEAETERKIRLADQMTDPGDSIQQVSHTSRTNGHIRRNEHVVHSAVPPGEPTPQFIPQAPAGTPTIMKRPLHDVAVDTEPAAKSRKIDTLLNKTLYIEIPSDTEHPEWNLIGQTIVVLLTEQIKTIADVKNLIVNQLVDVRKTDSLATKKFQLKTEFKFLKDTDLVLDVLSNLPEEKENTLEMRLRKRGGR